MLSATVALSVAANLAQAATFDYVFQQNITSFTNSLPSSTELLSKPYASMKVLDTELGVQIDVKVDRSYSGWLDQLNFNYIPQLNNIVKQHTAYFPDPTPPAGQPYFYSDLDWVNGYGTSFSFPDFKASSTIFSMHYDNPFGEKFSFYFRNLPEGVSAATFVPQYLDARYAYDWGKLGDGYAYVLATPVPEPTSLALFSVAIGLLLAVRPRRNG